MPSPENYQFDLNGTRPTRITLNEELYPGVQVYWPECTTMRRYHPINGVRAVVIHATAGGNSDGALWGIKNGKSSFHWLVPDEDEPEHGNFIWKTVSEELAAWHVRNVCHHPDVWNDKTQINHWSVGIELVNRQDSSDTFSEWQIQQAAKVVKYCWMKYPNLKHIVSHAKMESIVNPARRSDPGELFDWENFKSLVLDGVDDAIPSLVQQATPMSEMTGNLANLCCQG